MAGKKRFLRLSLVAVVALAAVAVIALTRDYDSPELGRAILERAGRTAGLEVRSQGFHLDLLRGLELEGVEITSRLAPEDGTSGSRFEARADRLVFEHRLVPLLRGEVVVEQIVLERPSVELVTEAEAAKPPAESRKPAETPPAPPASAESSAGPGLKLNVKRFAIVDGSLVLRDAAGAEGPTEIRGLDLELSEIAADPSAPSVIEGLTAQGEISAEEVLTPGLAARDAHGHLRLEGGHFRIEQFQLPTAQGRIVVGNLDADLGSDPYTYSLALAGDPLNTNLILGGDADGGFGPARLTLDLEGDGSEEGNVAGSGVLALSAGTLPGLPVLAALEKLVAGTAIIGAAYEPLDVHFRIDGGRLEIEPCELRFGEIALSLSGTVGFDGSLALRSALSAPRQGVGALEIPKEIVEALTDADGRVNLPISIDGSQESPKVDFDRSGWQEMAKQRVRKEAERELGKALGKLFGKKKGGT